MSYFDKEADLAQALIGHLKAEGWEIYEEVAPGGGGDKRADIVAVKDGLTRIIECKMKLGLPVLYQGKGWVGYAEEIFVAVPPHTVLWDWKKKQVNDLAVRCALEVLHIGVIEVLPATSKREASLRYHIPEKWPGTTPKLKASLNKVLHVELQAFNKTSAGGSGGSFWTPFKGTCKQVLELVTQHPEGVSAHVIVDSIQHHYKTKSSARTSLCHMAKIGSIPGIRLEVRDGTSFFTLAEIENAESKPKTNA